MKKRMDRIDAQMQRTFLRDGIDDTRPNRIKYLQGYYDALVNDERVPYNFNTFMEATVTQGMIRAERRLIKRSLIKP